MLPDLGNRLVFARRRPSHSDVAARQRRVASLRLRRLASLAILAVSACGEARAVPIAQRLSPPASIDVASPPPDLEVDERTATTPPRCPEGMATIGSFCIDRYEAHLVSLDANGALEVHGHQQRPEPGVAYEARSEAGVYPQAYISRVEAAAACAHAKKRLCSLAEWQRACMGAAGTWYPYGPHRQSNRCNVDKPHLLTLRFGADARRWTYEAFNDPALDEEPGFLARAGDYPGCVSEEGVYDLVGNVHEWAST
jgi:hypothetical protein